MVSIDDIISVIHQLPDKSPAADPLPVSMMNQIAEDIAASDLAVQPIYEHPSFSVKNAFIKPVVRKSGPDAADLLSNGPYSNLSVVSKQLERIVAKQLLTYLQPGRLPTLQSGFQASHSTETAVLRMLSDILQAVADVAALVLLDLSAAFDTV